MGVKSRHGALFKPRELKIMDGYICLYRKMLDWEWFKEPLTAHLFTCLLLLANQEDGWRHKGVTLHAGQVKTSASKLVKSSGLSLKEVRIRLERLQESGEIEVESTNHYSLITIVNFRCYQFLDEMCEGEQKGTQKNAANNYIPIDYKTTQQKEGTQKGTQTKNERFLEKKGTQKGIQNGTQKGEQKGTQKNAANNYIPIDYKTTQQKEGTQKGEQNGTQKGEQRGKATINIYIDNNIDNIKDNIENTEKKKKEKESENAKNAAPTIKELEEMFEAFRKAYKGTKRGFKVEFDNFKKKHQSDWKEIVPKLMPALENMEAWRKEQQQAGQFVPPYAMLQTWLNQQRWTTEYELTSKGNGEATGGHAPENSGTVNGYVPNYDEEF